jgi:SNF2 family DNA or RNA helicase
LDAYGQFRFLDDRIFGTNFNKFREHYGILEPVWGAPGIVRVVGYRNTEEFQAKINTRTLVIRAEDVLDLPPVHHQTRYVDLSPKGRKAYKEMKRDMITEWRDGIITADNALVKGLRLSQITGQDDAKPKALVDILEDFPPDEPVVVFAKFKDDIRSIRQVCNTLGLSYSELTGEINDLEHWRSGRSQIIVVQIDTGAEGIDLSRAGYVIYYSNTYNNASYEQSLSRPLKDGKKETVFYYHLIARETIDEDVYNALSNKQSVANAVLSAVNRAA